ncbi:hypothetical protein F8M41_020414 [Gigaspora margarita]|uniref:Uncharacterized protein n=1 Tax=Gigaspora margarita TaxID=4874 RepID=A0A8H4B201_GIGMA|nr:hypothetical protein F8M41_020414 [Gigaspora margarita]
MGQTDPDGDIEMIDPVENQLQESLKNTQNKISGDLSEGFNKLLDENKILQKQLTEIKDELRSQKSSSSEISRNVENDGFRNLEDYITKKLSEGFKNQNEELREQITRLENELKNLSSTSSDEPRHTIESNESKNVESRLKTGVDPQETELEHLRKDNKRLKDENASYQATMGIATSYRFADDDQNNSVHFNKDINDLNKNISKFVTNLKKDVKINSDNVSKLLQHYKYNKETQEEGIQLAKEVLRRLVIDTIINIYESHKSDNSCPENEIINNLKQLLDKLSLLNGSGNNDIMKSFLIKMRQQTYAILGNLAFTDEKGEHLFITHCKARLIYTINQYRIITNESKKKEIESQASSLVRDVISIFYFRRFAQEPIVNYKWIENDKPIDPLTMAGTWDEDEIDNLVVQTCSFPLFGVELENHVKRQIYTPARVIAKEDKD